MGDEAPTRQWEPGDSKGALCAGFEAQAQSLLKFSLIVDQIRRRSGRYSRFLRQRRHARLASRYRRCLIDIDYIEEAGRKLLWATKHLKGFGAKSQRRLDF
jgi:hypothetical protein